MSENIYKANFPYDAFTILVLLAVSCGCIVIALSQVETILYFSDQIAFLILISASILTVIITIVATFFRYQSMETNNKATEFKEKIKQFEERGDGDERIEKAIQIYKREIQKQKASAGKLTKFSGFALRAAILIIVFGFMAFVGSIWIAPINEMMAEQVEEIGDTGEDSEDSEEESEDGEEE